MSNTAVQGRTDRGIHRRVEHIIGMPINLAMRSRHTATTESHQTWQKVINQKIRPALRLELTFAVLLAAATRGLVLAAGFAERRRTLAIISVLGGRPRQLRGMASLRLQS